MKLIFDEHFKNLNNWNFEYGFVRNKELQYYTDKNIELNNGLTIYGKEEEVINQNYIEGSSDWRESRKIANYTSSSINTRGKFDFKYGIMEVKAKIPISKGAWPAIWLLGSEDDWPYGDEIDIMECYLWCDQPTILGNFMYYSNNQINWSTKQVQISYFKDKDSSWEDKFHIWKFDWTEHYMRIYLDDELINEIKIDDIKGDIFKKRYYILLNLAIGGHGAIPLKEEIPLKYEIEYVKVYQED